MCEKCLEAAEERVTAILQMQQHEYTEFLVAWCALWFNVWVAKQPDTAREWTWVHDWCWIWVGWMVRMVYECVREIVRTRRMVRVSKAELARVRTMLGTEHGRAKP